MKLVGRIRVELDAAKAEGWLRSCGYGEPEEPPMPEIPVYFREMLEGLIDDELAVATMFGPGLKFTLEEVTVE